ncbi:MAG TPA: RNA-directed DNA polymerase [Anaerolineae bacterium]|nr:RNA-directed DNA polymerase [Anaerolineae bacterium]
MTTLSSKSIEWAIEHLVRHCDTDIFPKAFEFEAINYCRDEVTRSLSKQDICQWQTRAFRRCLVPKQRYGFRLATQLDPLDMLFYLALCFEVGEQIEKSRFPAKVKLAFSYRFAPDSSDYLLFDRNIGYADFQEHSGELAKKHSYVVLADIADFYPRIYLHRLENALSVAVKSTPTHAKAIVQLIKGWNQNVSYGIPVGNNSSRLLAELVIDDVDRTLFAENVTFTRFVDDYRIFCHSKQQAYQCLARLANILYETHGLTLQSQKTKILPAANFVNEVLETEERKEIESLAAGFDEIIDALGLNNPYEMIDYDLLSPDVKAQIDGLNLEGLLDKQMEADDIDISMTKFLINRLGQLQRLAPLRKLIIETDKLYPVFPEVIRYLARLVDIIEPDRRVKIGKYLLDRLKSSVISHLEFHRMQIMSLFAGSNKWGNADKLAGYYNVASDNWFRRTLLIAIGRSEQHYWLRAKKSEMDQMPIWERRAFIYAASCFPKDERENYYRAVSPRLDNLERYVVAWAQKNPISS